MARPAWPHIFLNDRFGVMEVLNKRQEAIIAILKNSDDWMTGKELCAFFNVSDRTIRSDIVFINQYYNETVIKSDDKNGYHLNAAALSKLNIQPELTIIQSSFERCLYIIQELLFKESELNLLNVIDKLYVSYSTLENDLREIKKLLEPYPALKLVRRKNYIYLRGNEESIRKFYVNLLMKKIKENILNLDIMAGIFTDYDFSAVRVLLEDVLKKYNYCIRRMEFPVVIAYVGTAVERMLHRDYIQTPRMDQNIADSMELIIADEFYNELSEILPIEVKRDETAVLALILFGKRQVDIETMELPLSRDFAVDDLVNEILQEINIQFELDLREDEILKKSLSAHILLLIERKKNDMHITNLCLDELKYKYPFIFEMAVWVASLIKERLDIAPDENDITFFEQQLGGALERVNHDDKYRVIIINPNDQSLANLCMEKIKNMFYERVTIIGSMNYFEREAVLKAKPDLILTTLPIEHNLDILTVVISIFVNLDDEIKVFKALNLLDNNKLKSEFASTIKTMMEPRFFYVDLDLDTPQKVLSFMSDELYSAGLVEQNFKDEVLKREGFSPTSYIYSFAIPHPLSPISRESRVSVALLKKPIQWGDFQVKLVLLLSIKKDNQKITRVFFNWLSNVVSDSKKLALIMKTRSYDEFMNNIIE